MGKKLVNGEWIEYGQEVTLTGRKVELVTPVGFEWTDHPLIGKIFFDIDTKLYSTDFDVADKNPHKDNQNPKTYYVDPVNGSDSNVGDEANPFKSAKKAITQADVDVIILESGIYSRSLAFTQINVARDITIKTKDGNKATFIGSDLSYPWTKTTNQTNVYETNRTSVYDVFDTAFKDKYGDYEKMIQQVDIASVDANPGSYYTDGTIVYVHTFDSRSADESIRINLTVDLCKIIADVDIDIYMENVDFEGAKTCAIVNSANGSPNFYVKNCNFKYGNGAGCLEIIGANEVIAQDCEGAKGTQDGFNYHAYNNVIPKVIEINCVGRDNGSADDNDNGSTTHDGGKIIRLNGSYLRNKGPNVADVSDDTDSWNIGCTGYQSKALSTSSGFADFFISTGSAEMWLEGCSGYGSGNSLVVGTGSKAYVRDSKLSKQDVQGTLYDY